MVLGPECKCLVGFSCCYVYTQCGPSAIMFNIQGVVKVKCAKCDAHCTKCGQYYVQQYAQCGHCKVLYIIHSVMHKVVSVQ